jgi:hypothetical protein
MCEKGNANAPRRPNSVGRVLKVKNSHVTSYLPEAQNNNSDKKKHSQYPAVNALRNILIRYIDHVRVISQSERHPMGGVVSAAEPPLTYVLNSLID